MAFVPLSVIIPVPALKVRLVTVPRFHAVPAPESVISLAPRVKERALLFEEENDPAVMVSPFVLSDPWVRVMVLIPTFSGLVRVQPPPAPLNVTSLDRFIVCKSIVWPAVIAENVIAPVKVLLIAAVSLRDPAMVRVADPAHVGLFAAPVQSMLFVDAATSMVTVCPAAVNEFASKKTSSEAAGTAAPPAPPDVVAQCAVSLQFPVPPTQ